jgi:hypothetical protein
MRPRTKTDALLCASRENQVTLLALPHSIHPNGMWFEEDDVKKLRALAAILFVVGLFAVAWVSDVTAQEQQSFKIIIGKGYEIKGVTFARGESTENREIFLVTLQKDKSVAVCYFAAATWINLSPQALDDSKRCDVR